MKYSKRYLFLCNSLQVLFSTTQVEIFSNSIFLLLCKTAWRSISTCSSSILNRNGNFSLPTSFPLSSEVYQYLSFQRLESFTHLLLLISTLPFPASSTPSRHIKSHINRVMHRATTSNAEGGMNWENGRKNSQSQEDTHNSHTYDVYP